MVYGIHFHVKAPFKHLSVYRTSSVVKVMVVIECSHYHPQPQPTISCFFISLALDMILYPKYPVHILLHIHIVCVHLSLHCDTKKHRNKASFYQRRA